LSFSDGTPLRAPITIAGSTRPYISYQQQTLPDRSLPLLFALLWNPLLLVDAITYRAYRIEVHYKLDMPHDGLKDWAYSCRGGGRDFYYIHEFGGHPNHLYVCLIFVGLVFCALLGRIGFVFSAGTSTTTIPR
jgi:hypothetical protein